jgi:hypothetical protein
MIRSIYRLVKLSGHVFLGYACYEFVRGLMDGASSSGGPSQTQDTYRTHWDDVVRDSDSRKMSGKARTVRTEEADGGSSPHAVGGGVVSQ